MNTSSAGLAMIQEFESCSLTAYADTAGVMTIGWGHTRDVRAGDTCSQQQADAWLALDVETSAAVVGSLVQVPLSQPQFDALVSFAYNVGAGALRDSTLLKLLNAGCYALAAAQFTLWDYAGGMHSDGLLRRRQAERDLFSRSIT